MVVVGLGDGEGVAVSVVVGVAVGAVVAVSSAVGVGLATVVGVFVGAVDWPPSSPASHPIRVAQVRITRIHRKIVISFSSISQGISAPLSQVAEEAASQKRHVTPPRMR
jgi:hypothetical protein